MSNKPKVKLVLNDAGIRTMLRSDDMSKVLEEFAQLYLPRAETATGWDFEIIPKKYKKRAIAVLATKEKGTNFMREKRDALLGLFPAGSPNPPNTRRG